MYIFGGRCVNCGALGPHGPLSKIFCGSCYNYLPKEICNSVQKHTDEIQILLGTDTKVTGENMCGSCAGTGTPISGRPCMCGGTGKASDAVPYLLKRIQWLTDGLAQAWFDGYAAKEAGLSSYKADDRRRNFINSIEDGQ